LKDGSSFVNIEKEICQEKPQYQGKRIGDQDDIKGVPYGFSKVDIRSNDFDIIPKSDKILFSHAIPIGKTEKKRI
jgi:hypothetical protein